MAVPDSTFLQAPYIMVRGTSPVNTIITITTKGYQDAIIDHVYQDCTWAIGTTVFFKLDPDRVIYFKYAVFPEFTFFIINENDIIYYEVGV
jgi:hypothetical protein